jgi:hypothetical protein
MALVFVGCGIACAWPSAPKEVKALMTELAASASRKLAVMQR